MFINTAHNKSTHLLFATLLLILGSCALCEAKESEASSLSGDGGATTKSEKPFYIFRDNQPMASIVVDESAIPPPDLTIAMR